MMNALRLRDGFPLSEFTTHTGLSIQPWLGCIEEGVERGLLSRENGYLRASDRGFELLNEVLALFMPAETEPSTPSRITIPIAPARD